jgi:hypothetical protein
MLQASVACDRFGKNVMHGICVPTHEETLFPDESSQNASAMAQPVDGTQPEDGVMEALLA